MSQAAKHRFQPDYAIPPGETLRQLLTRAGGFTPDADLFASEFTRESVRRLQRQRLSKPGHSLLAIR